MVILYLFVVIAISSVVPLGSCILFLGSLFPLGLCSDACCVHFCNILFLISSSVLLWSFYYLDTEAQFVRFVHLVFSFLGSMFLLIFSANLVTILVGWDLLGFTSFFLVSFYGNRRRHAAALITALRNRVGDCFYFLILGLTLSSSHFAVCSSVFLLLLVGMTKSAQLPFSSWLPSAIYAPTPVSALVHSSTLVTAGIFLLMRFSCSLDELKLSIGVLTTIFAGIAACLESDSKKIIALSTLSQLGIIITGLGLGLRSLTFNHMLTHAVVKALLFVCIGIIIHASFGSQELRYPHLLRSGPSLILVRFIIGIVSLGGLAFTACFFTKDALLETGYRLSWGLVALFFFYISLGLTVAYLLRVLLHFFSCKYQMPNLMPSVHLSFFLFLPILILLSTL